MVKFHFASFKNQNTKKLYSILFLFKRSFKFGDGSKAGSCYYDDICTFFPSLVPNFNPTDCPPSLKEYGIDCTCPFTLIKGPLNIDADIDIPSTDSTIVSFLTTGDYQFKMELKDDSGPFACIDMRVSLAPARSSK